MRQVSNQLGFFFGASKKVRMKTDRTKDSQALNSQIHTEWLAIGQLKLALGANSLAWFGGGA